jgi:hemoglobin
MEENRMRTLVVLLTLAACAHAPNQGAQSSAQSAPKTDNSLYERLGGKGAIIAVVDDFVGRIGADERITPRFANTDLPHLKQMLVEQICAATGGPCKYTGRDMKTTHKGLGIRDEEFGALVEDLQAALESLKVAKAEQNELLGALGGMKGDIVEQ